MRRYSKMMLAALAGCLAWGSAAPASADGVSFSLGAGFTVGRASFHVAYASPGYGYAPYYYRTSVPLRYEGYRCSSYCRRGGSHWYHAPNCPLVGHHFSLHGYQGYPYPGSGSGYYPVVPPPRYYGHGYSQHYYSGYESYGYGYRGRHHGHYRPGHGYGHGYGHSRSHYGRSHHGNSKHGYRGSHGKHHGHAPGAATRTRPRHN